VEKTDFITFIHQYQQRLCNQLEREDGLAKFITDEWTRPEGGGGTTRILENGRVIEKAGVNTSVVFGPVTGALAQQLQSKAAKEFFACGVSVVIHPLSPMIPTAHANFRYFEMYDEGGTIVDRWFGGGCDLTPYYLFDDDVRHFHAMFQRSSDRFDSELYPKFRKQCDEYFFNRHRNENRGVGGIFYDYIRPRPSETSGGGGPDNVRNDDYWLEFSKANADAFVDAYFPIVERRKNEKYSERHVRWQEIRRGRYVEFNLIHDRGTLFGLRSGGRTESILMSLPPRARFDYNDSPPVGSEEERLVSVLKPHVHGSS
jgi:coproporphyrinogen III oxidase